MCWRSATWRPRTGFPAGPPKRGGLAAAQAIETGAALALSGEAAALVTGPISKEALQRAGRMFPGHTEMLAHLAGGVPVVMMLAGPTLRVVLVTIHTAYRNVPDLLTPERIVRTAWITNEALQRHFNLPRPRLAVAGLNPHAGENGLFGREEPEIIAPAVEELTRLGIAASGPFPPEHPVLAGGQGRVRRRGLHVPRPGADSLQAAAFPRRGQRDPGPAVLTHVR